MNIFVITDLHIGKLNKSEKLVSNLINFFIENRKELSKVDCIVLDGDTFDRLLASNSQDYKLAMKFIAYITKFCDTNKIILRGLEGTPSHDNKQLGSINEIIKNLHGLDYKYISSIQVEYFSKFDKYFLYLPDKMKDSGEEIQQAVLEVLKENNLTKVDMIFAHGNFKYQLPVELKSALDENFFLNIVRYYVVIGHIHNRSIWQRIIAPGSFDRLEVNQEEDKGGVLIKLGKNVDSSMFKFISNTNAIRYDTLDLLGSTVDKMYKKVSKHLQLNGFDKFDHIRLKTDSIESFKELKLRLESDGVVCTIKRFEETSSRKARIIPKVVEHIDVINITSENVSKLVLSRDNISGLSNTDKQRIQELLKQCS